MTSSNQSFLTWSPTGVATTVLVASTIAALCARQMSRGTRKKTPRRRQCSVPRNPTGILQTLIELSGPNAHTFLLQESEKLQSLVYRIIIPLIPPDCYIVGDPVLAREILSDAKTEKPRVFYDTMEPLACGLPNIFTSRTDSPHWKCVRKGTASAFSKSEISRMKQVCLRQMERWVTETLEPLIEQQKPFDPQVEMVKITFRVICEAAFEYPIVTDKEISEFSKNVELALIEFDRNEGAYPFRRYLTFCLPGRQKAFQACQELEDFCFRILEYYRKNPNKSSSSTVIKLLVENPALTTDRMKVAEMIIFLIAGHDTTGFTLAAALYHMAKHPEACNRLRKDLLSNGSSGSYFQWFLRENFRMLPVASMGSARITGRDFIVPPPPRKSDHIHENKNEQEGAVIVPKGALVITCQVINNQSSLVFDRPSEFDPMRWENASPEQAQFVMPFAVGARNCIGQALAKTELETVLSLLAQNYRYDLTQEGQVEYSFTLTMKNMLLTPKRAID